MNVCFFRLGLDGVVLKFWNVRKTSTHFNELTLPRISEGGVQSAVLLERVLSVEDVDAEVAQRGAEHVLLGAVLQQAVV